MTKEQITKNFREFVLNYRGIHDITQKELAEKVNANTGKISRWERGATLPDAISLLAISKALGVTINEMLEGELI